MSKLLELAEHCEQATGPDRSIDGDIAAALALHPPALTIRGNRQPELFKDNAPGLHAKTWLAPNFTASLDAAMTLVETPTDQWGEYVSVSVWDSNGVYPEHVRATAWVRGAARVYAATPALALCAAALRARASIEGGEK